MFILPQKLRGTSGNDKEKIEPQPTGLSEQNTSNTSSHRPLFPRFVWFATFVLYHGRRFSKKKKQPPCEDGWFVKSVNCRLNHYGAEEYERDFLSVDCSNYGSMSKWNGEELNKFDI